MHLCFMKINGRIIGSGYARDAYRTYKWECALCRNSDVDVLEVHHIDEDRDNCEVDNLIILCANCHTKLHRKHYKITTIGKIGRIIDNPDCERQVINDSNASYAELEHPPVGKIVGIYKKDL